MPEPENRKPRRPLKNLPPDRYQPKVLWCGSPSSRWRFRSGSSPRTSGSVRRTSHPASRRAYAGRGHQERRRSASILPETAGRSSPASAKSAIFLTDRNVKTADFHAEGVLTDADLEVLQKSNLFSEPPSTTLFTQIAAQVVPFLIIIGLLYFLFVRQLRQAGRGRPQLRQEPGQAPDPRPGQGHLRRRRRLRRGQGGDRRGRRIPEGPEEVHEDGRAHAQGRPDGRAPRNRQDAAGQGGRRRGRRAVLQHLRLGLRRDVRRRGRLARARHVRAGPQERALPDLHRRDRRRRPPARRGPGRRQRRARADAQFPPGGDGRLRHHRGRHHHRGDQPAGRARQRAAAPGPLRPPDLRRPARPLRPRADPAGPRQEDQPGRERRPGRDRARHARALRRRTRQPPERGGPPRRPAGQEEGRDGRTSRTPARRCSSAASAAA